MIASPSDVMNERNIIREVLAEWNSAHSESRKIVLLPVSFETHTIPEMGGRPQAIINKQILNGCDFLIGVFWTRIGTPTGDYFSGSMEEIEKHIKVGKPAMLYFSSVPVKPESVDQEQYAKLIEFKESCKKRGLYETYEDVNSFRNKLSHQLQIKMNQDEFFSSGIDVEKDNTEQYLTDHLSIEAKTLLKSVSKDPNGLIIMFKHIGGILLKSNHQSFESKNPRERALLEAALEKLENENFIVGVDGKKDSFRITQKGYEMADLINKIVKDD
jgi:hypothetical protein